jgi:cytochrome P450
MALLVKNLVCVLSDLFTAGSDTTSSTLSWAFLYMLHYPEVLAKVREEIDTVVGRDELPSSEHRAK